MYRYRLKLIFGDKQNCILLACTFVLFLLVAGSLSAGAQNRSNIPIGLIDRDHSESSEQLATGLKQIPALYIYEGGEQKLNKLLYSEQISAIFVLEEGYEESVRSGDVKELVTMYYLEDKDNVKVLSDIFAGEMLYEICLSKGYNLYESLPAVKGSASGADGEENGPELFSRQEYVKYAKGLAESADYDFAFDIEMVSTGNQDTGSNKLSNSVIYLQIIWGILGMLLPFAAMIMAAGVVLERESGLYKRIRISLIRTSVMDVTNLAAILTVLGIVSIPLCILVGSKTAGFTFMRGCALYLLMLLYSAVTGLWFLFLGKIIKKTVKYQYISVFSIILAGILGFFQLIGGFIRPEILNFLKLIPNNWFIQGFTDIILSNGFVPYQSYAVLGVTVMGLYGLNCLTGYGQNKV